MLPSCWMAVVAAYAQSGSCSVVSPSCLHLALFLDKRGRSTILTSATFCHVLEESWSHCRSIPRRTIASTTRLLAQDTLEISVRTSVRRLLNPSVQTSRVHTRCGFIMKTRVRMKKPNQDFNPMHRYSRRLKPPIRERVNLLAPKSPATKHTTMTWTRRRLRHHTDHGPWPFVPPLETPVRTGARHIFVS
jgi:hypothetical protein